MNFVNPLSLIGAAAVAVPILLHLIKREHARKIEFPTLMFLRRISKKTIRYQKLRDLLLLLLRVLAFLLVVLAFMRPYRERTQAAAAVGRVTRAHIILLDHSMSMGYQTRWNRAKKAAADIVRNSQPGDKFAVLEFTDRTAARTQLTTSASEALAQIERGVELTDQPTRYGQALKAAERHALDAGTGKRIIHLISDFQKNGWAAEEQEFRLSPGIDLEPTDVGSKDFSNLAIREVRVVEADAGAGGGVTIKGSVFNFGNGDRKDVRVNLVVDSRPIDEKRVDVPKGASQGIEFQIPGLISGAHAMMLEVDDPELTRDNRFYMTVESRGKTPVLVVENSAGGGRRTPSFLLVNALNVDTLSPYKMTAVSPQGLVISGRLVVWNNVPGGNVAAQNRLQAFVQAGGGLAIILADSSQWADFNRSFASWLPVKISEAPTADRKRSRPVENYVLMTDVRMDHPIFQPFGKPHSGAFSGARFFDHARLTVASGAEVPARFDNGDPALVAIKVGKGRVLIFASSADDTTNDLPLKAVYAPLWQQMLRYLESFHEKRHWFEVGDILAPKKQLAETALSQAKGRFDISEAVVVLGPRKQRLELPPGSDAIEMDGAGFYEIRSMNLSSAVAVNTVPKESDLTHGNAEEMIAGWLSSRPAASTQEERLTPEEQDRHQRLWNLLLIAAILFLLGELLLSNSRVRADEGR